MNIFLLGAGASKGYNESKTEERMPLAKDFFRTFKKLKISESPLVLIGSILNYLIETNRIVECQNFDSYEEDIEALHSEVFKKMKTRLKDFPDLPFEPSKKDGWMELSRVNYQLVFLFNAVINEIQNGKSSVLHKKLIKRIKPEDTIITFNWDTLLDRVLCCNYKNWSTDTGYFITPKAIYRDKWDFNVQKTSQNAPLLLKLHGSTNWLTSYPTIDKGSVLLSQHEKNETFFVYEHSIKEYPTYKGRYISGYEDFSYGYYPVNLPVLGKEAPKGHVYLRTSVNFDPRITDPKKENDIGLTSMPLIIPPTQEKEYSLFGSLFTSLWDKAKEEIIRADKIFIIGYSFPKTDVRSTELFLNALMKRDTKPEIIIINPSPDEIAQKFSVEFGLEAKVYKEYFDAAFDFSKLS